MRTVTLHRWLITNPTTGKKHETRYRMTEADARALDPQATPVPWTMEERMLPDDWITAGASHLAGGPAR
jgi:hypothetical protein